MSTSALTYEESAQTIASDARAALLEEASKDWIEARQAAAGAAKLELVSLNRLRDCGVKLREAAGKEAPSLTWFKNVQTSLPADFTFSALQFTVHLARKYDRPFDTLDEARAARRSLFDAFGTTTPARRIEAQTAWEKNPWNEFVNQASSLIASFTDLDDAPLAQWNESKLRTFIAATDPIVRKNAEARALLKK
jgi:hypothetical protein